ncbi:MAG: YhbY family RNA-binding protein [Erysipelotrichaceae bacterium]|jgi:RNA-binding protein|nr:YhbY family RNA-binding protein [Erysipelotrichaceae bacterium]
MLTSKQKSYLKSLANPLKALVLIGKDGLTLNIIESTKISIRSHELVKVSVLKSCTSDVREMMLDLSAHTNSEVVSEIGRTFVLFKESEKHKITLPQ